MEASDLILRLNEVTKKEVYFGPQGFITFSSEDELKQGQIGFGFDKNGTSLAGNLTGDWQVNWIVIGSDTELGDPYFVDINDPNLAVFTAVHGEASWETEQVAITLASFFQCLSLLSDLTSQQNPQFVPDDTSITDLKQLKGIEEQLISLSSSDEFWTMFMACYLDWLKDDEY